MSKQKLHSRKLTFDFVPTILKCFRVKTYKDTHFIFLQ